MSSESKSPTGDLLLSGGHRILAAEIVELASRSSGPGGQHVNTSNTRVSLRWDLRGARGLTPEAKARVAERLGPRVSREGLVIVHADRHRSRRRNREEALERLRELVEGALHQAPPRRPTAPSRAARARRLDEKRRRGQRKSERRDRGDVD